MVSGEKRLVLAVRSLVVADPGAALARSPKVLAFAADVIRHHRRRGLQNILRGAVVLFEADDLGLGKIFLEFKDVADVGAAPGINRLVFVAHGTNVMALARQHAHQFVLRAVRVLVFVDEQILEAAIVILAHGRGGFQQTRRFQQQIIEIEGIGFAQFLAIFLEQMRDLLRLRIGRLQVKLLRIEHVIFRPRDAREHGARRELLVVDAEALHHRLDHRLLVALVVDHEFFRMADRRLPRRSRGNLQSFNVASQNAHAERMKRRDDRFRNAQSAHKFLHAFAHFGGGLVGKGHRQNGFRHHSNVLDQVSNAVGNDPCLAAPRAREDEHRALGSFDGLALLRVELIEKRQCGSGSGADV